MIRSLFDIIKEEGRRFFKDSGAMLIMIVGVIAYSIFYMFPYSTEIIRDVPIGVIDMDNSNLSREYVRNLNATDSINVVSRYNGVIQAEKDFYSNNIRAFILIPKNFGRDILRGRSVDVAFYGDSGYLIIYKTVYSAVVQTSAYLGAKVEIGKLLKKGVPMQMAKTLKQPFEFVQTPLYNPAGGYATYIYPVILVLILHQTLLIGVGLMQGTKNELKEEYCKQNEYLPRVLFGKATFYVMLYLFYSIFYFLIYPAFLAYPMSYNILPLIIMLTIMFYCVVFFSLAISYLFKQRETSLLLLVVTSLIFIFLPGLIWPKEAIPQLINLIALFIPAICSVDGIVKINQMGATFWDIRYDVVWLILLCILYFRIAVSVIKRDD